MAELLEMTREVVHTLLASIDMFDLGGGHLMPT